MRWLAACVLASALPAQTPKLADAPPTTFGVTIVDPFGLCGEIYLLDPGAAKLPRFEKLEPVGAIYASGLNIPPREFHSGFPGVTDRFEWFAIDYAGNFWVETPGDYRFLLTSDDGSRLYIDNKLVVNNDGVHSVQSASGHIRLKGGIHRLRLSYFQGPRFHIALTLGVARPGEDWRVFSTDEFRPPRNPDAWRFADPNELPTDPNSGRRNLRDLVRKTGDVKLDRARPHCPAY